MYLTQSQYCVVPLTAVTSQQYSYTIEPFTRQGVEWRGYEEQPGFSEAQLAEIVQLGGVIFDSASAFLEWKNS